MDVKMPIASVMAKPLIGPVPKPNNNRATNRVVILASKMVAKAVYYKTFGLIANLALTFNLVVIVAVLSMLQATLTLPGIAGIVLTVGMAVDANVLIFERIKEELRNRNSPQASIFLGYEKAFATIFDANITTLLVAHQ
jgi:preprotein translocase subunit SecD